MTPAQQLLAIAQELSESHPILALELERNVLASSRRVSIINPGAQKFEQHVEKMVTVLKSMVQELNKGLKEIDSDDASEFSKFFEDVVAAEEEQLRSILDKTKSLKTAARLAARTAGPLDFVKNIFKKKEPKEDESKVMESPSYTMDDSTMDDFVEGKSDWADSSHYIEQEFKENKEFFNGAADLLKQFDSAKKKPSRSVCEALKKSAERLTRLGENMLKVVRKHLLEPALQVEITEDGMNSKKPAAHSDKMSPEKLENTVEHYVDMLKESLGDEKKTLKFLKELFSVLGPIVQDDRASIAAKKILPVLVRIAHASQKARPVLIPIIRRIVDSTPASSTASK